MDKNYKPWTRKTLSSYGSRYAQVLITGDASELLTFSTKKRQHAMQALAALSKFIGHYDSWKVIKEKHNLKWTTNDDVETFKKIISDGQGFENMLDWVRSAKEVLPAEYFDIILYGTLTGLRPAEACYSIDLLQKGATNYYNEKLGVLEHFQFPDLFIRRTKKAYISLVTLEIMDIGKRARNCGYNALRLALKRKNVPANIKFGRKIFGTYLRSKGIDSEIVDLLQGRMPKSVFIRHYYRPNFQAELRKVQSYLQELQVVIES